MASGGGSSRSRRAPFPRWTREVGLLGLLYAFYEITRGLQHGDAAVAARNGWAILHSEQALDIDPEHLLTHALVSITPLAVAFAYFYSTMHYVVTPVVMVWMYRCHRPQYRTARTALVLSTLGGLVVFWALPTAPPRLLPGAGVPDALSDVREWGWWGGEGSVPRGLGGITNQFAALPSLHVGWALWCGVLIYRYASRRWVRTLGLAYPVATTVVVLSTGNHYLLDTVAGAVLMVLGALAAVAARSLLHRARAAHGVGHPPDRGGSLVPVPGEGRPVVVGPVVLGPDPVAQELALHRLTLYDGRDVATRREACLRR